MGLARGEVFSARRIWRSLAKGRASRGTPKGYKRAVRTLLKEKISGHGDLAIVHLPLCNVGTLLKEKISGHDVLHYKLPSVCIVGTLLKEKISGHLQA